MLISIMLYAARKMSSVIGGRLREASDDSVNRLAVHSADLPFGKSEFMGEFSLVHLLGQRTEDD